MAIDPGTEAELRRAERALYDAMVARDFAAFERLLAPDLVYVHSTAVAETRAGVSRVWRGDCTQTKASNSVVRVRGGGAFVLMDGICDMRVGAKGQPPQTIHLLFVLVWSKAPSGWQLLHRHATRMADAGIGGAQVSSR